jgi:hypothetical protein
LADPQHFDELSQEEYDALDELLNLACDTYDIASELSDLFRRLAGTIVRLPPDRRVAVLGVLIASFNAFATEEEPLDRVAYLLLQVALVIAAKEEEAAAEALRPLMKSAKSKLDVATELSTDVLAH